MSGFVSEVTLALFVGFLLLLAYRLLPWLLTKTPKNLPPGPREWDTNWQILKAAVNDTFHELATDWAKKYGPLTFIYHLGHPMLFLNSAEVVRKLLSSPETRLLTADRVPSPAPRLAWYNGKDLVFTKYDAMMRKKRRMLFKLLNMYGDGVHKFEEVVGGEMERLIKELEDQEGNDVNVNLAIGRSLKIIIYILVTGERPADITTPDILEHYDMAFNRLWAVDLDFVLKNVPILAKVPGKVKKAVDALLSHRSKAEELIYHQPKRTFIPGKPRGIADLVLQQELELGNEWMADDPEQAMAILTSLYQAGHLTTRGSLLSLFLCFVNYPDVVKKIQNEIDQVLGDRQPRVEDRMNMPYVEATGIEVLRVSSPVPLSGVRQTTTDFQFEGMTIPKDTVIFINNWHFLHDENVWEDPWSFKPERFLDNDGQLLPADHPVRLSMVSFGIGARSCPGEVFARSRVFMFITCLLQKFDILPPANEKVVPADFQAKSEEANGFIRQVPHFKCRFVRRKKQET